MPGKIRTAEEVAHDQLEAFLQRPDIMDEVWWCTLLPISEGVGGVGSKVQYLIYCSSLVYFEIFLDDVLGK